MFSNVKTFFYKKPDENFNLRKKLKPIYYTLSLFGLFPYSIKFDNKNSLVIKKKSFYINSLCAVSYMLFVSLFVVLHILYVYDSIDDSTMTREVMTKFNYVLELSVSLAVCVTGYVSTYIYRYLFVKIINDITHMIEALHTKITLKNIYFKVNVVAITSFLFIILLLQVCVNFTRTDSFWKMNLVFVTFILPQQIQFTLICFYYWLISMLLQLLTNIKLQISSISEDKMNIMDCCMKRETRIITLQYLETMYVKAFQVKENINTVFEAPILVTVVQSFHSMISEAHIIYHGLVVEKDFDIHPLVNCSIWIIYQVIKIYILGRSGTLLNREVKHVGQVLHSIPTDKHDIRLLLEIQHFSSLMSQQNNVITAYGLFTIDATLLSKIVSSSAMYIIILVQFDKN